MDGKVTYLYPIDAITLPDELRLVSVNAEQAEDALSQLSVRYARWGDARQATAGDAVYCKGEYPDGRTVLLYPGAEIHGAEKAEAAVLGKVLGDCFPTELAGKSVTLTVEKIMRPVPVQVDDDLIFSLGIDGVATVEDYRAYILCEMRRDAQMEQSKMAVGFVLAQLEQNSTFAYDRAELDRYMDDNRERLTEEYRQSDLDPTEEELRQGVLGQQRLVWLAREVCRQQNVAIDRAAAEDEAEQMAEMLELMGESADKEALIEDALDNAYISELFGCIEAYVAQIMEG